ncbi:hypothetical protein BJX63DRAFT_10287 [Aspergillus granulosus]|uniref:Uncharacterized protein n=1 Tax=Aspergillus granulosus TaxID=176169 RepID=A0ABR4HVB3_9EURO
MHPHVAGFRIEADINGVESSARGEESQCQMATQPICHPFPQHLLKLLIAPRNACLATVLSASTFGCTSNPRKETSFARPARTYEALNPTISPSATTFATTFLLGPLVEDKTSISIFLAVHEDSKPHILRDREGDTMYQPINFITGTNCRITGLMESVKWRAYLLAI